MKIITTYPVTIDVDGHGQTTVHVEHEGEVSAVQIPDDQRARDVFQWMNDANLLRDLASPEPDVSHLHRPNIHPDGSIGIGFTPHTQVTWLFLKPDSAMLFKLTWGGV